MKIKDHYNVYYKDHCIAGYFVYENGDANYSTSDFPFIGLEKEDIPQVFKRSTEKKGAVPFIAEIMTEENRVKDMKRPVYQSGNMTVKRVPQETGEKFIVYKRSAKKGEEGYSAKDHSAPHYEGPKTPEGMKEWASWYCFNKMDDGTYEAELDEAWWWGGGHNDGGTIHTEIPEEWFDLSYDEFLENVVTLAAAATRQEGRRDKTCQKPRRDAFCQIAFLHENPLLFIHLSLSGLASVDRFIHTTLSLAQYSVF